MANLTPAIKRLRDQHFDRIAATVDGDTLGGLLAELLALIDADADRGALRDVASDIAHVIGSGWEF